MVSEIMAFHALASEPLEWSDDAVTLLLDEPESRLSEITFSGGSIQEAMAYLAGLGLEIIETTPPRDAESDQVFGKTVAILDRERFEDVIDCLESDCEEGQEVAEDLLTGFEDAAEEVEWLDGLRIAIIW